MPNIEVQVADAAWQSEPDDPESITRRVIGAIEEHLGSEVLSGAIAIRFSNNKEAQILNAHYRDQDKATNVLSFPAPEMPNASGEDQLGDVILAYETVRAEARLQGKSFSDHCSHLVAHGVLHLLGYDHQSPEDASRMEALERDILSRLEIDDPYKDQNVSEAAHGL